MDNCTAAYLAELLAISERRVNQLAADGTLERTVDGKFDPPSAIEAYYTFKLKSNEKIDYDKEKALHEAVKREKSEIQLEQYKRTLLSAVDVERAMSSMILTAKSRLLALPAKVAPKVIGQKNIPVIEDIIKREVNAALCELSEMPAPPGDDFNADD